MSALAQWLIRVADSQSLEALAIVRDDMNHNASLFTADEKIKLRQAVADRVGVFNAGPVAPELPKNVECPKCSGPMKSRRSKFGMFWGCADYPQCNGTRNADGEAR